MAPPGKKKKNHEFVIEVRASRTSTGKLHERSKRGQNLKLCDLPADLVANILDGLSSADRIRFGATCKNNLSLVAATTKHHRHRYQFRAIDELPWLAQFSRHCSGSLEFILFDPFHIQGKPNYATYTIKDPKGESFGPKGCTGVKALNKGWLLCLWPKQEQGKETGFTSFLLFSPINQRIIKLPDLKCDNLWPDLINCQSSFSSDPSSLDCIYFFLYQNHIPGKFIINTLDLQKSKEWKTIVFDKLITYVASVVYHDGCFYCLSETCQLAAYDVVHRSWKVIIHTSPLPNLVSRMHIMDTEILVCEGKVILVVLDTKPIKNKVETNTFCLFEFSSSAKKWVKKISLGNHALFVGQTSFSLHVSSSSNSDNIANRVYFYSSCNDELSPFYYSLEDGQCHPSKDSGYWSSDVKAGEWIQPPSCLTDL